MFAAPLALRSEIGEGEAIAASSTVDGEGDGPGWLLPPATLMCSAEWAEWRGGFRAKEETEDEEELPEAATAAEEEAATEEDAADEEKADDETPSFERCFTAAARGSAMADAAAGGPSAAGSSGDAGTSDVPRESCLRGESSRV